MATSVLTHQPPTDLDPASDQAHLYTLTSAPSDFLQPTPSLTAAALVVTKRYADPLASSISTAQEQRLQDARRKRKRGDLDDENAANILRLKEVYIEGFAIDQVYEQTKRVLAATRQECERFLPDILSSRTELNGSNHALDADGASTQIKTVRFDEKGFEIGTDSDDDDDEEAMDSGSGHESGEEIPDGEYSAEKAEEVDNMEVDFEDAEQIEDDESGFNSDDEAFLGKQEVLVKDKHGLNDGFFSIDEFNRTSEFLERQDAKGDPDDGAASDEEEIDFTIDPMTLGPLKTKAKSKAGDEEEDDASEEDGPTFGNADLNAPWSSDDEDDNDDPPEMDMDTIANTNEVYYQDFFAPPAKAPSKNKKRRPLPKTQPEDSGQAKPTDEDVQRTIDAARRDIFEDDDLSNHSGDSDAENNNLSTHERKRAALASRIRELEAEAVAKREWTLVGEARAADRPLNSLLEEDLEFERAGKPVPVITDEVTNSIEELIKSRILARNFDEVQKRYPGVDVLRGPSARRGLVELDDKKPEQSLAEIYETEHLRKTDPNFVDQRDAALKAQHDSIEKLWKEISSQLDAMTSLNYKPKPADVEVKVVTDAPRITLEDARPSGIGIGAEESGLAPQEVYKPGAEKEQGEVVTKGGAVVGTEELTREQKLRRRRREKERLKKRSNEIEAGATAGKGHGKRAKPESKKAKEEKDIVASLKKGGVRVIGKGGEVRDVEGNIVKTKGGVSGGGFKL